MITTANFGNYVEMETEPAWFKAENYDYCDSFFEKKHTYSFSEIVRKLFGR